VYKILANLGFKSNTIHYLPSCHSTNEIAANLLGQVVNEGELVITDDQTDGSGQRGKKWESAPYLNLTFSLILMPEFLALQNQFRLTQAISVSLASIIQAKIPNLVKIKWPNDIYVEDKKIAGILIQNTLRGKGIEYSIIGIGLNVNQIGFSISNASSLKIIAQKDFVLNDLLNDLVQEISENYHGLKTGNHRFLNEAYQNLLYKINVEERFVAETEFKGTIIGTDQLGRLLIKSDGTVRSFQNNEVRFASL